MIYDKGILLACGGEEAETEHTITGIDLQLSFDKKLLSSSGVFSAEVFDGTVTIDGTVYQLSAGTINRASEAVLLFFQFKDPPNWESLVGTSCAVALQDLVSGGLCVEGAFGVTGNKTDGYDPMAMFQVPNSDWENLLTETEDAGYDYAMFAIYQIEA